jgi:hypothetical protein
MSTRKQSAGKRSARAAKVASNEAADEEWPRLRKGARTLFDVEWPPGFDDGRRLLIECPEFKLFERWPPGGQTEFEYAPEVESALFKSLFRINDKEGALSSVEERIEIAKALLWLLRSSRGDKTEEEFAPGCGAVGTRAARSVGALLQRNLEKGSFEDAAKVLGTCVRGVFAHEGRLPDRRSCTGLPIEAALIYHLRLHASINRVRPSKRDLIEWLKPIGLSHRGKDSASKWRASFDKAALSALPDK